MHKEAILVSTFLCCIIQVIHIPNVGANSTHLVQILGKSSNFGGMNYTSRQGPYQCGNLSEVINLNLTATLTEIRVKWSQKNPKCFSAAKYRVTTTGVDRIVSGYKFVISGLACRIIYKVTVTPVSEGGVNFGVPAISAIETKGVPEVINLNLTSTITEITAEWSQKDPNCFPETVYEIIATGGAKRRVDQIPYTIRGLACHISYNVTVTPFYAGGKRGVPAISAIKTEGVPEVINLNLIASLKEISMKWIQRLPGCFPGLKYRVTTTGVDKIVTKNQYVISGLACGIRYSVTVTPVGVDGVNYGVPAISTIETKGENLTRQVKMTAPAVRSLVVVWDRVVSSCQNITGYAVTFSTVPRGISYIKITNKTYFHIPSLEPASLMQARVQPVDGNGKPFGVIGTVQQTTQADTSLARCPFPSIELYVVEKSRYAFCAVVVLPARKTLAEANATCASLSFRNRLVSSLYFNDPSFIKPQVLQARIKSYGYTETLMMFSFYSKNWTWGIPGSPSSYDPVDPKLLISVPEGGSGPNDYKYLYLDPAKGFGLSAAKDGFEFGGILCLIGKSF